MTLNSFCLAALACVGLAAMPAAAAPLKLADYMALRGPEPTARIAYGPAPSQYVELFQPDGPGPFPVVILVHGGCWQKAFDGIPQMRDMAGALSRQGVAVWSVEYRRLDEPGGGYPGLYEDVIAALDKLGEIAPSHRLDLGRVAAVGHSAGGHLVQWIAGRDRIPKSSPLHRSHFLRVKQIIALGSLGDLRGHDAELKQACGVELPALTGAPNASRPDVYLDTSPAEMIPNGSRTVLINGALDTIAPPEAAKAYAAKARRAGDDVEVLILPDASHFDEVATASPAWRLILPKIRKALGLRPTP